MFAELILLNYFSWTIPFCCNWIIPFHEATRGNLVWKYSCGRDGGFDASGCMRHCRVDHGHCHSQWKETKGLAVDSLLYHPTGLVPRVRKMEVEKNATGNLCSSCSRWRKRRSIPVKGGRFEVLWTDLSTTSTGFPVESRRDLPEQQGRALRRDSSVHPPQNGEKNQKGPTDGGKASGEGSGLSMGDPCSSFGKLPKPCSNG